MTRRPKAPILPEAELGFRRRTARPSAFGFDSRGSSAASPSKDHHGGLLCRPTTPPAPPGSVSDTVEARPESLGHGGLRAACCGLRAGLPLRVARNCPGRCATRSRVVTDQVQTTVVTVRLRRPYDTYP